MFTLTKSIELQDPQVHVEFRSGNRKKVNRCGMESVNLHFLGAGTNSSATSHTRDCHFRYEHGRKNTTERWSSSAIGTGLKWEEEVRGCTEPVHGPHQMGYPHDRVEGSEQSTAGRTTFDAPTCSPRKDDANGQTGWTLAAEEWLYTPKPTPPTKTDDSVRG